MQDAVPPSWPSKPIIVTSFSFSPDETFHVFDEVEFNGDMETCYKKIHGVKQKFEDDLPNTMGQSPAIGTMSSDVDVDFVPCPYAGTK